MKLKPYIVLRWTLRDAARAECSARLAEAACRLDEANSREVRHAQEERMESCTFVPR